MDDIEAQKKVRKSYQLRALARKTLSYQKRQSCTNICCVCLCPLMMVVFAGALSIIFNALIASQADTNREIASMRYCANNPANFSSDGLPLVFSNQKTVLQKGVLADQVIDAAYYKLVTREGMTSHPCVHVYDQDYQTDGLYYGSSRSQDATFYPAPDGGWFDPKYFAVANQSQSGPQLAFVSDLFGTKPLFSSSINQAQQLIWSYVFGAGSVNAGYHRQSDQVAFNQSVPVYGEKSGFLGQIPSTLYKYNSTAYVASSFYQEQVGNPDNFMRQALENSIAALEIVFNERASFNESLLLLQQLNDISNLTQRYPAYGALIFESLDNLKVNVILQGGSLARLDSLSTQVFFQSGIRYPFNPARGMRYLFQATQLSNALLSSSSNPVRISHAIRAMPFTVRYADSFPVDIGSQLGLFCYPFALAFLFPTFVLILVKEKEDRILVYLKMNGISVFTYYLTHYVHFIALQLVSTIVFIIAGNGFGLKFFTVTQPLVYIILLILWANCVVAFALLFSLLFNKSRFSLMVSFFVVTLTAILSTFTGNIFNYEALPLWWLIMPFFTFFAGLSTIGEAVSSQYRNPYKLSDLTTGDTLATIMLILLLQGCLALLLTSYLNLVLPSEFGVQKPWYFIFSEPYFWIKSKFPQPVKTSAELIPLTAKKNGTAVSRSEEELALLDQMEDDDVKAERTKVLDLQLSATNFDKYPMIVKEVRKVYGDGKVANKNLCFTVDRNACFALLGPNGSGKTTLIHQLVGLYPTTSGTAYLAGFDINTQQNKVHQVIGVCPQHDILYDDLTCCEHLLFYGRLKGIPIDIEQERALIALKDVGLSAFADKLSKTLSGGERRRLSLAIALLDDGTDSNGLVFLDEPTTGVDVEIRRVIWNIIQDARKKNKSIILTSHALDEVEVLSTEVAIMSKGILRCIGTTLDLKKKYGKGYKLQVTFQKNPQEGVMSRLQATTQIEALLPEGYHKVNQGGVQGSLIYEFDEQEYDETAPSDKEGVISKLLTEMEAKKNVLGVEYGISQTSLEEVFLNIVNDEDAEAGAAPTKKGWLC